MRLISACEVVGPPGVLPTKMRSASRRAYSSTFGFTRRSTTSTSASCRRCTALSVRRSGSPGPQPISATRPACASVGPADPRHGARRRGCGRPRPPRHGGRRGGRDLAAAAPTGGGGRAGSATVLATVSRRPWARLASVPKLAGSSVSSRVLISRASTGAAPSVPIATVTGSRSTMAGMMKVESAGASTTLTGMPRALAARETAASSSAVAGCGIDEALALEVARQEGPQQDPDGADLRRARAARRSRLSATTVMRALVLRSRRTFCAACSPPPTTSTSRLLEIGKEGEIAHGPSGSRQSDIRATMKPIAVCPCAEQATRGGPDRQGGRETGQDSARALPVK